MTIGDGRKGTHQIGNGAPQPLPNRFDVHDVVSGDDHTLILSGELDVAVGDDLEAMIISCAHAAGLTLDLRRLTFMDSTGLTLLLLARDLCQVRGMAFALIPGPAQVQRVFEIAGLLGQLPFELEPTA